jgi:hypothetical protein
MSECLVLGAVGDAGDVILLAPDFKIQNGLRIDSIVVPNATNNFFAIRHFFIGQLPHDNKLLIVEGVPAGSDYCGNL